MVKGKREHRCHDKRCSLLCKQPNCCHRRTSGQNTQRKPPIGHLPSQAKSRTSKCTSRNVRDLIHGQTKTISWTNSNPVATSQQRRTSKICSRSTVSRQDFDSLCTCWMDCRLCLRHVLDVGKALGRWIAYKFPQVVIVPAARKPFIHLRFCPLAHANCNVEQSSSVSSVPSMDHDQQPARVHVCLVPSMFPGHRPRPQHVLQSS